MLEKIRKTYYLLQSAFLDMFKKHFCLLNLAGNPFASWTMIVKKHQNWQNLENCKRFIPKFNVKITITNPIASKCPNLVL